MPSPGWCLLVGLVAVVLVVIVNVGIRLATIHEAITKFEKHGGSWFQKPGGPQWLRSFVGDDFMVLFDEFDEATIHGQLIPKDLLNCLNQLDGIRTLDLSGSNVTDAHLTHLSDLTTVEHLDLCWTDVTDDGLMHLEKLTHLKTLDLSDTCVTDAGLVYLQELSQLIRLDLSVTEIDDATPGQLTDPSSLQDFDPNESSVSDAGLVHLQRLHRLKELRLYGTSVTDEGIRKLQSHLPHCRISFFKDSLE